MKTAILVIDMIKGMEAWVAKKEMKKIFPNINRVLDRARANKFPIIYVVHTPLGKKGTKFYREIAPTKNDFIIKKKKYSSFYKTKLDDLLKKLKVNKLILTGVATNWCVLSTALDAHYKEYKTVLLEDCVAAPNDFWHKWSIKWMLNTLENFNVKTSRSLKW